MASQLFREVTNWFRSDAAEPAPARRPERAAAIEEAPVTPAPLSRPLAFVIDDEEGICKFVGTCLGRAGIEALLFSTAPQAIQALNTRQPALIFLDIALKGSDAVDVLRELGRREFNGVVQLMSGTNQDILEDVRRIGARHGLNMNAPLNKPFRMEAVQRVVTEANLGSETPERVSLSEALANGWIDLWYQPKIDLRTMTLAGAEGLARCRHPTLGILPPARFLRDATPQEHVALTEFVVTSALRDWSEFAAIDVPVFTSVNTSAGALTSGALPNVIRENRPQDSRWPGLILEVTESEVIEDVALIHEIATQLRIYGISLAIDDFGEGFSSFARLRELPFAELKLDGSFVANCSSDRQNAGICQAIIDLAHHFGAIAVAERIETAADLQAIHRMGCDLGQGYLLSRPMPKAAFIASLRARRTDSSAAPQAAALNAEQARSS